MKTNKQTKGERKRERKREKERERDWKKELILIFLLKKTFVPLYRISKIPKPFSFYSVAMKYAKTLE